MVRPSTLTIAEASISGDEAWSSRKRSTISWVRDFVKTALLMMKYCRKTEYNASSGKGKRKGILSRETLTYSNIKNL